MRFPEFIKGAVLGMALTIGAQAALAETVGVSWARFQEERWTIDEAALRSRLEELGHTLVVADANGSVERQAADIEGLIARGADILLIVGHDSSAVVPAVQSALDEGIPVIAYERQIKHPDVTYVGFDPVLVGRAQATALLEVAPEGNYVLVKGGQQDQYAHGTLQGQMEVLQSEIDSGNVTIVAEDWTTDWKPEVAQSNMENFITALGDTKIDAVLCSNDGMAGGVAAALEDAGLLGLPLSGQDGDIAAINRIARGQQTMTAWKDVRQLGKRAAELADAILAGVDFSTLEGATTFELEGGAEQRALPLTPTTITAANIDLMVDAGWVSLEDVCRGVESGTHSLCN